MEQISFRQVERYLEGVTPLLGNIMWSSQAAALVPQMRFIFTSLHHKMQLKRVNKTVTSELPDSEGTVHFTQYKVQNV
jgi:hypothetical protein